MAKLTTPILLVIEREGQERRIEEFNDHIIKIGKLSSVNLRLDDPNVNRIHAVIEVTTEEEAQVIDMGSSKGTRVNGKRIHKARVVTGDQIVLGDTALSIYIGEAAVSKARLGDFGGGAAAEAAPQAAAAPAPAPAAAAPAPAPAPAPASDAALLAGIADPLAPDSPSESTTVSRNPLLDAQNIAQGQPLTSEAPAEDTAQFSPENAQAVRDATAAQQQGWEDPNSYQNPVDSTVNARAQDLQPNFYEEQQGGQPYQQAAQQTDPYGAQQAAQQAAIDAQAQAAAAEQAAQQAAYEQQQAQLAQQQAYEQQQAQLAQQQAYEQQQAQMAQQQAYEQQQAQMAQQAAYEQQMAQQAAAAQAAAMQPQVGAPQDPYAQQQAGYGMQQQGGYQHGFVQQQPQGYGQPAGFNQGMGSQQAMPAAQQAPVAPLRSNPDTGGYADSQEVLEVRVLWGDTILDHAHFYEPKRITVGESRKNTFSLSSEALPDSMASFPLIEAEGDRLLINFTDAMGGEVHLKDQVLSLDQIKQSSKVQRTAEGYQFALPAQSRVRLFIGDLVFEISFVPAPKRLPPAVLNQMDHHLARSMGASFLLHGIVILLMLFADESQQSLGDGFLKQPNRFAQLIIRPAEPDEKKKKKESGGAKAKGKEGKMGKKNAANVKMKAGQKKKNPDGTAPIDMQKTAKAVMDRLTKKGLLGLLPGGGNKAGGIITAKGFGGDDADALGGWHGSKVGNALGGGGLGLKGGGAGGGGFSGSGAGLGRIGTYGRGGGKGGRNWGKSRLRGKRRKAVTVSTGPPAIYGGLDRKIIQRIINQHRRRFKYCYERELIKNPQLQGKIHVWFQIEANGRVYQSKVSRTTMNNDRVEQCLVRRVRVMRFPAPKGGGVVIVNYPFIFRPS